ncbi:MAG: hypothetical protein K5770_14395 [Lachnospiraceae bacterium]|nr:hypothetical protein [Lachnospiraceae bacterium]
MSTLIEITVPVKYETGQTEYKLIAAKDDHIIGRDPEGGLSLFEWNTGKTVSGAISEEDIRKASDRKVRRNFWARKLTHYWSGKTTAESVIDSFAADDLVDIFEPPVNGLKLNGRIPSLSEALLKIVED